MRDWRPFVVGVVAGAIGLWALGRMGFAPPAHAQYLSKFQHVQFDFDTTGTVSTMTFFNRETGEVYLYVASGKGDFQFARRMALKELGEPMSVRGRVNPTRVPQLPTGLEPSEE